MSSQFYSVGQGEAIAQGLQQTQARSPRVEQSTSDLELFVRMSYGTLVRDGEGALGGRKSTTIDVYRSRFRTCLKAIGAAETDEVAQDFVNDVDAFIARVTKALEAAGESTAQVSAPIRAWREAYLALVRGAGLPQDFSSALKVVVSRYEDRKGRPLSIKAVSNEAGVPYDSLRDWLSGRHEPDPHQASRLELALELKPGVLMSRLRRVNRKARSKIKTSTWPEVCRGDKAKALRRDIVRRLDDDFYSLSTERQTAVLEKHRLAILAEKAQRAARKNPWVPKDGNWPGVTEGDWQAIRAWYSEAEEDRQQLSSPRRGARKSKPPGGWKTESAVLVYRNRLAGMAGWLGAWARGEYVVPPPEKYEAPSELPHMRELLGDSPVSLALFVDSRLVHEYVRYRIRLSDDPTENSYQVITTMQMLLREGRGYLRQAPEKWEEIPKELREDILGHYELEPEEGTPAGMVWDMVCEAARDDLADMAADHKEMIDPARGFADIMPILSLKNPMDVLKQMHKDMWSDLRLARGRDHDQLTVELVISKLLARTGLRRGHLPKLTYTTDNKGSVRIDEKGRVSIRALVKHFKNRNSSRFRNMKPDDEILLPINEEMLQQALRYYLLEVRPRLAASGSNAFLVVPSTGVPISAAYVATAVYRITETYISEDSDRGQRLPGQKKFGPHKYRHIVATSLVKKFKDLKRAARFLMASMRVVEKHYALFLPTDEVASVEEDLDAL